MATEWTMNTAQLEKGMLIRRPGLDESLEVVNARNGQAKIKLPDGKTSTIPASAEVEWAWPESKPQPQSKPVNTPETETEPIHTSDDGEVSEWQTDWSLLDVGSKISVLGDTGDFTVLRLGGSSARIKHNATGQIQPMSIGHKFRLLDSGDSTPKPGKAAKAGKTRKPRSDKGTKVVEKAEKVEEVEATEEAPEISTPTLFDDEPSDEVLDAIENGDEPDDDEEIAINLAGSEFDDEDAEEDETEDDEDLSELVMDDIDRANETDNDDDTEDDKMPVPAPKPAKTSRSTSTSLLTLGQIAERTGISYPTLVRYVRDHGDRLPSEGEGRARRFTPDAVDVFKQIRSETKGGRKPGAGKGGNKPANPRKMPSKPVTAKPRTERAERSHETAAPYAAPAKSKNAVQSKSVSVGAWVPSSGQTIDQILTAAIDHARAQIDGLQSLIDNLEAQRESLKLWS